MIKSYAVACFAAAAVAVVVVVALVIIIDIHNDSYKLKMNENFAHRLAGYMVLYIIFKSFVS